MDRPRPGRCTGVMQHNGNALVVLAHHRADSLTAHIARRTVAQLEAAGRRVDLLDLHAEGFDPRMNMADQPDWGDREKLYSAETRDHMRRVLAADEVVAVFPVYWMSVPALLKGWIDRVWNYGFAYGRSTPRLAGKRILWLGLAGATGSDAVIEPMRQILDAQLNTGIAYYCGFAHAAVGLLPDAEERPQSIGAEGEFVVGEAVAGAARTAQYAEFEARAAAFVADFLAGTDQDRAADRSAARALA